MHPSCLVLLQNNVEGILLTLLIFPIVISETIIGRSFLAFIRLDLCHEITIFNHQTANQHRWFHYDFSLSC